MMRVVKSPPMRLIVLFAVSLAVALSGTLLGYARPDPGGGGPVDGPSFLPYTDRNEAAVPNEWKDSGIAALSESPRTGAGRHLACDCTGCGDLVVVKDGACYQVGQAVLPYTEPAMSRQPDRIGQCLCY